MFKKFKVISFGCGQGGKNIYHFYKKKFKFIGFSDNNSSLHHTSFLDYQIFAPEDLIKIDFDFIIISSMYFTQIKNQLIELGIPSEKIIIPDYKLITKGKQNSFNPIVHNLIFAIILFILTLSFSELLSYIWNINK